MVAVCLAFAGCDGSGSGAQPADQGDRDDIEDYTERVLPELVDVGNDRGFPRRVLPDGQFDAADTMSECSTGAILADRVVTAVVEGERRQLVVSEFGEDTLFDSWAMSSARDIFVSGELEQFAHLELDVGIDEVRANAGSSLVEAWDRASAARTSSLVFGTQHHLHPNVLFVQAVGHTDDVGFTFVHPCPDVLNDELRLASELSGRPIDEQLAIEILTDKQTIASPGYLLRRSLRDDGPPISVTPAP